MGLGRSAEGKNPARVGLLQDGVAAVPALGVGNLLPQCGAIPNHRRYAEFGILFCINCGRMNEQNAAGVFIDDIPDDIVLKLGFTNLGRGNKN